MQVYDRSNQQDLYLVKALIDLTNLSVSKTAEAVGIQRTNLSAWLNGKQNVFSDQRVEKVLNHLGVNTLGDSATGVRFCDLDSVHVHKWYLAEPDHLTTVLETTLSVEELQALEVFQVNTKPHGMFNLIRTSGVNGDVYIILCHKESGQNAYPLPNDFQFGKLIGSIDLPVQKWIGWLKTKELLTSDFRTEINSHIFARPNEVSGSLNTGSNSSKESKSHDAGLRAVIRSLLAELRNLDPDNRLLVKTHRDEIYNSVYLQELNK